MENYMRLFQELDAFSLFHLLRSIQQPTLIISGALDTVTPALSSMEMARRMPHASHYCDPFSTHMSLLESPEWCVRPCPSCPYPCPCPMMPMRSAVTVSVHLELPESFLSLVRSLALSINF
jgi:hypothetical protein